MTELQQYASPAQIGTIESRATGAALIRESAEVMATAHALAQQICDTAMVPEHFRGKPHECAAAMLYGASLGLDPMQSVKAVYVVKGNAALYAAAMAAIVRRDGHKLWTVEASDESVTVAGQRRGETEPEVRTWTYERANKAGYTSNAKYKTNPQQMLYAKAVTEVCRAIAPDSLAGVYSAEEIELEHIAGEVVKVEQVRPTQGLAAALGSKTEPAAPGMISQAQVKEMGTLLNQVGVGSEKTMALAYVGDVIGRQIEKREDLTADEAQAVIDAARAEIAEQQKAAKS